MWGHGIFKIWQIQLPDISGSKGEFGGLGGELGRFGWVDPWLRSKSRMIRMIILLVMIILAIRMIILANLLAIRMIILANSLAIRMIIPSTLSLPPSLHQALPSLGPPTLPLLREKLNVENGLPELLFHSPG